MGTRFNQNLKDFFSCEDGAYSVVTVRESEVDSQITVTGHEKAIFKDALPTIMRGSIKKLNKNGIDPSHEFKLYPGGANVKLNVNFPKAGNNELRLYLQNGKFRPDPFLFWFTFIKEGKIWIGALDSPTFGSALSGNAKAGLRPALLDINDNIFQEAIYSLFEDKSYEATVKRIHRDPTVTKRVLQSSGYKCELFPDHPTFVSRFDNNPYLEAHHVIPISLQPQFELKLDVEDNIAILNPWSHRMLHHGRFDDIKSHVISMTNQRAKLIDALGIGVDDVLNIYGGS